MHTRIAICNQISYRFMVRDDRLREDGEPDHDAIMKWHDLQLAMEDDYFGLLAAAELADGEWVVSREAAVK